MVNEKRIIDGYAELHSVRLDGAEEIVAENPLSDDLFRIYKLTCNNPLGIEEYRVVYAGNDYLKVMREFLRQLEVTLDRLDLDRVYRGFPFVDAPFLPEDCIPGGLDADLTGKVIAIKQEIFSPEFRACTHQLHLATGGFGCSPSSSGRAVYCINLYSGEKSRFERNYVLGVIAENSLPQWAQEKLTGLRDPTHRDSTLTKLRESRKIAEGQPHKKKELHDNGGPEHSPKKPHKSEPER